MATAVGLLARDQEGGRSPDDAGRHRLGRLQRQLGNRALGLLLRNTASVARQVAAPVGPAPAPAPAAPTGTDADRADATRFLAGGPYGPRDVTPGTGDSSGGFEVTYDPRTRQLRVVMRVSTNFIDGIITDGSTLRPGRPELRLAVAQARRLRGAARTAFIAGFQWTSAEKVPWMTSLQAAVESAWSNRHQFHINRPGWDWIGATVNVDIQTRGTPNGTRHRDDHLLVETVKMPADENLYTYGGSSFTAAGGAASARDQGMVLASSDIGARPDANLLRMDVLFGHGQSTLSATARSRLRTFIRTYQGAPADRRSNPTRVRLEGHASASGSEEVNQRLTEERVAAVRDYLAANGFTNVATRVTATGLGKTGANEAATAAEAARERRVELIVDSGERQVLAAHEFGHAFGLGDEYATGAGSRISGTGDAAGTAAEHDAATHAMEDATGTALPGAIHENNEGIMSLGNAVRPQHYSMFHTALELVTARSDWALGPPAPAPAPIPRPAPTP